MQYVVAILIVLVTCLPFAQAGQVKSLKWQLPQLTDGNLRLTANVRVSSDQAGTSHTLVSTATRVELTAEPGQQVIICASQLLNQSGALLMAASTGGSGHKGNHDAQLINAGLIHLLQLSHTKAQFTAIGLQACPENLQQQNVFHPDRAVLSKAPFLLITRQEEGGRRARRKRQNRSESEPFGLAGTPDYPEDWTFSGGGSPFDDDPGDLFKRRRGGFDMTGSDISLTLLPLVRLDWDWMQILSMNNWRHWLFGSRDESSGVTLVIRINGKMAGKLQLSPEAFRQLTPYLIDIKQTLRWLAPRLNGREGLIDQLLQLNESGSPLSDKIRQAIEQQIAAVLEWTDNEFSHLHLSFELHQLENNLLAEWSLLQPDFLKNYGSNGEEKWLQQLPLKTKPVKGDVTPNTSGKQAESAQNGTPEGKDNTEAVSQTNPQPGTASKPFAKTEGAPGYELTITFIGRFNAGKSSLASTLLGGDFFPSDESRTEFREKEVVIKPDADTPLQQLRVRSLPGYGSESAEGWLKDNPISQEEMIVFVFHDSLDEDDGDILERLVQEGHSFSRMIFVRNKFDAVLNAEIEQRQQASTITVSEREEIAESLKRTLQRELRENLEELSVEGYATAAGPELFFTSCTNLYQCEGFELLFNAIKASIHQAFPNQARELIWANFAAIRAQAAERFFTYTHFFKEAFKSEKAIALDILELFASCVPGHITDKDSFITTQAMQLRHHFRLKHRYNYEDKVVRLRYLDTWESAEAERIKKHASELSKKSDKDRERYLVSLQETIHQIRRDLQQGDHDLQEALDFSAFYKADQYVMEFRDAVLKSMKKQMWWIEKVATSDDQIVNDFKQQLSRAIDAELQLARYQRMLPEPARSSGHGTGTDIVLSSQPQELSFRKELQGQIDELAQQFTTVLMSRVIMPVYYHMPLSGESGESEELVTPEPFVSPAVSEAPSPLVGALIPQPDIPTISVQPSPFQPEEPLEQQAADIFKQFDELLRNKVSVTLSNGFERSYHMPAPPFFSVGEQAAVLAAFQSESDWSKQRIASLKVSRAGQCNQYDYRVDPAERFKGTEIGRTKIRIKDKTLTGAGSIEAWVDFEQNPTRDSETKVIRNQTEKLDSIQSLAFAPRAFIYEPKGDEHSSSPLLVTRVPEVNLAHLVILQNSSPGEANKRLAAFKSFTRRQRFTDAEIIELAAKLVEGLKALDDRQIFLGSRDIARIGIDLKQCQPYPEDLLYLHQDSPASPEQGIIDFNLRKAAEPPAEAAEMEASSETQATLTIKWLGQVFTLLSGKAAIYYQKEVATRVLSKAEMTADLQKHLNAFHEDQLKNLITDLLNREGVKSNLFGRYPEVSVRYSASQNLLLLARLMLRHDPGKRPSLDDVLQKLNAIRSWEL